VVRQLALCRSIYPLHEVQPESFINMLQTVERVCDESGMAGPGDRMIITGGAPFDGSHHANLMMIHELPATG